MVGVAIEELITKITDSGLIKERDRIYCRNQIMGLIKLDTPTETNILETNTSIPQLVHQITDYAVKTNVISGALDEREQLEAKIMDTFLPKPSELNEKFALLYHESPMKATDYFYNLSQMSHYIQTERIAKNIHYQTTTAYGNIDITINLSKPEKDPLQIKREKEQTQTGNYPTCVLCPENEGYVGRIGSPARSNHRIIDLELMGETWFFQYSPYVYYNEHSIVLNEKHQPMKITKDTFTRLFQFVEQFPHYFIGSNADLPIVGGSILSHDHYQAGRYTFGMTEAEDQDRFSLKNYSDVNASILKWPMSVIRLRSTDYQELVEAGGMILAKWRDYSDPEVDIMAFTGDTPHNTITPIARYRNHVYELDLVLRNNRTTDDHPDGIFHPHQDVHHIKKENIGLIEVMGLAVLPPRLKEELTDLRAYLLGQATKIEDYHRPWAEQIKAEHKNLADENVDEVIREQLAKKFVRVLENAGVFKENELGNKAFKRFISTLN